MSYESKAIPKTISATSRVALKIKDNYFTVEYSEERELPTDVSDIDMEEERKLLFDDVNSIVDQQMYEIQDTFRK